MMRIIETKTETIITFLRLQYRINFSITLNVIKLNDDYVLLISYVLLIFFEREYKERKENTGKINLKIILLEENNSRENLIFYETFLILNELIPVFQKEPSIDWPN